jgi:hypothetical protein
MIEDELIEEQDDEFFEDNEEYGAEERESSRSRRVSVRRRPSPGRNSGEEWAKQRRRKGKPRYRSRD